MLRFIRLLFALFLSQVLLLALGFVLLTALAANWSKVSVVEQGSLLWIRLSGEIVEYSTLPPIPFIRSAPLTQSAILESLERAAMDDRITAVLLDVDGPEIGWGKAMELHQAILRFRDSRKPIVAIASDLDELELLVASACDSIFMPNTGRLYLNGIAMGPMYFKGTLDKLDIHPNVQRIGAYKDATETTTRSGMSEESREQSEWLLDGIWSEFLEAVTSQRNLGRADLEEALTRGILHPQEAVELGLVDGVRYREEIMRQYMGDWDETQLVDVFTYHRDWKHHAKPHGKAIAVVHARGLILRGSNDYSPGVGAIMGAGSVIRDLEDAAADDDVVAVVLRVDSPGGEVVASDMISRAVERVRRRKPVVVSMVDVAASGGYMMSFRANRIVALPSTITGSIGVLSEKWNMRGFYDKLGMSRDFVSRGSFPYLFSDYHDWSEAEAKLVARQQEMDYERWIADIADSRKLTTQMVDNVGRGRVWTGEQALEHGLVDDLGGQRQALEVASELANLPTGMIPRLVHYPKERSFMDLLLEESDTLWSSVLEHWGRGARLPRGAAWSILDWRILP